MNNIVCTNKIEFNNSWIEFNNKYKNLLDPNERRAFCLIKKIWTGLSSFVDKTWRYSSIYLSIRVHFTSLCGELQNKHFGFFFLDQRNAKQVEFSFFVFDSCSYLNHCSHCFREVKFWWNIEKCFYFS